MLKLDVFCKTEKNVSMKSGRKSSVSVGMADFGKEPFFTLFARPIKEFEKTDWDNTRLFSQRSKNAAVNL